LLKDDSVRPIVRGSVYLEEGLSNAQVLTGQEAVQLHQQLKVDIVTLRCLAVRAANVMSVEIDTYSENLIVSFPFRSRDNLLRRVKISAKDSLKSFDEEISTQR
jgi:hypothetical protein